MEISHSPSTDPGEHRPLSSGKPCLLAALNGGINNQQNAEYGSVLGHGGANRRRGMNFSLQQTPSALLKQQQLQQRYGNPEQQQQHQQQHQQNQQQTNSTNATSNNTCIRVQLQRSTTTATSQAIIIMRCGTST
ncbi:hypothetical protein JCM33374_g5574 [Metschnikowia sp. JCM 33374]|nr:hypothetical protein JCM33374_g5574 [Metschnikowia sp. JCM 33374]